MKQFIDMVGRADRGQLKRDIDDAVKAIIKAVEERGGTGKITVTLDIKRGGAGIYRLDFTLKGRDPRQPEMDVVRLADAANGIKDGTDD